MAIAGSRPPRGHPVRPINVARGFSVSPDPHHVRRGRGNRPHHGVAVFFLIVGTTVGLLINVFTDAGGSHSDFDTKDPATTSTRRLPPLRKTLQKHVRPRILVASGPV